jgi:glutaredoxin-related protein
MSEVEVVDSGFGYTNNSVATLVNITTNTATNATALVITSKQGVRQGLYTSTNGFVSDGKFLQDGNYYQLFSYEIRSSIPFSQYEQSVLDILHTAGTRLFGKTRIIEDVNLKLTLPDLGNGATLTLANLSGSFTNGEIVHCKFANNDEAANGIVIDANSTVVVLSNSVGTFSTSDHLVGANSTATANITYVENVYL